MNDDRRKRWRSKEKRCEHASRCVCVLVLSDGMTWVFLGGGAEGGGAITVQKQSKQKQNPKAQKNSGSCRALSYPAPPSNE